MIESDGGGRWKVASRDMVGKEVRERMGSKATESFENQYKELVPDAQYMESHWGHGDMNRRVTSMLKQQERSTTLATKF